MLKYTSSDFSFLTKISCLGDIHLQVLLNYAEEDLYNAERQTFAFPLLHALLKRQLRTPEMDAIGDKILKLAVTADSEAGRNSAKNFFCAYLMGVSLLEFRWIFSIKNNLVSIGRRQDSQIS